MVDLILTLTEEPLLEDQAPFYARIANIINKTNGQIYVLGMSIGFSGKIAKLRSLLPTLNRETLVPLHASTQIKLSQQLEALVLKSTSDTIIYFHCGVAYPDLTMFDQWLENAIANSSDSIVSAPLFDPVTNTNLLGFTLSDPCLHPVWNTNKTVSNPQAVALPILIGTGRAKAILPYATFTTWPYSSCALLLSLHSWIAGITLKCQEGVKFRITPQPASIYAKEALTPFVVFARERLLIWRELWGYEAMLLEGIRLACGNPIETGIAIEETKNYEFYRDAVSPISPRDLSLRINP